MASRRSLGVLSIDLIARTAGFTEGMNKAERETARWRRSVERDLKRIKTTAMATATVVGGALTAAVLKYTKSGLSAVSEQNKLAKSFDTTFDSITQLNKAFRDENIVGYEASLVRLNRRLGAAELGRGAAYKTVQELNLNVKELLEMNAADRIATIADRIKAVAKNTQEAAWHTFALGFQQKEAGQMFIKGGDAIREAATWTEKMGLAMSDLDATKVEIAADSFADIKDGARAVSQHFAVAFTPAIVAANNAIIDLIQDMGGAEDATKRLAKVGIDVFATLANAADGFRRVVVMVGTAVGGVAAAWDRITTGGKGGFWGSIVGMSPTKMAMTLPQRLFGTKGEIKKDVKAALDIIKEAGKDIDATLFDNILAGDKFRERLKEEVAKLGRDARAALEHRKNMVSGWEEEAEAAEKVEKAVKDTAKSYLELKAGYDEIAAATLRYRNELAEIAASTATQAQKTELATLALERYQEAIVEANRKLANSKLAYLELKSRYDDSASALLEYKRAVGEINHAQIDTAQKTELLALAQQRYNEAMEEMREKSYWEQWLEGAEEALTSFDELAGDALETFTGGFGNALESMIFDIDDMGDSFKNMIISMSRSTVNALGQMAAQWMAYKLVTSAINNATASGAAAVVAGEAMAQQNLASLNAYASTAAIPVVGPTMAPAAAATAKASTMPFVSSAIGAIKGIIGMSHDGIDMVPKSGTWLLERGERVVTSQTSARLDRVLDNIERGGGASRDSRIEVSLRLDSGLVMENLRNDDDFERAVVTIMNRNR